jgi:hypothetical protein
VSRRYKAKNCEGMDTSICCGGFKHEGSQKLPALALVQSQFTGKARTGSVIKRLRERLSEKCRADIGTWG